MRRRINREIVRERSEASDGSDALPWSYPLIMLASVAVAVVLEPAHAVGRWACAGANGWASGWGRSAAR